VNLEQLTATEARVAGLVAGGHDDREISTQLAIGAGDCARMLSEIYRKLGIGSRTELSLLLGQDPHECEAEDAT
jgi:DNA-binding NarL/FixJ family response regulator